MEDPKMTHSLAFQGPECKIVDSMFTLEEQTSYRSRIDD